MAAFKVQRLWRALRMPTTYVDRTSTNERAYCIAREELAHEGDKPLARLTVDHAQPWERLMAKMI
eukprot:10421463-Alexandrium_andersonii.AAC.1